MDRILNYIFTLLLVCVFTIWSTPEVHSAIIIGLFASFLFCAIAYIFRWLTLSGAAAALLVGTITFGLGGWPVVTALLVFFMSSALISRESTGVEEGGARRNGRQVWANGFWVVSWLILGIIVNQPACWGAAWAAIATATADTWATELGSLRFNARTFLITNGQSVDAGTQGGVSWPGIMASFGGSAAIGIIIFIAFQYAWIAPFLVLLTGFTGALIDSLFGATVQGSTYTFRLRRLRWHNKIIIDNNMVNWMAIGLGSSLFLILNFVI